MIRKLDFVGEIRRSFAPLRRDVMDFFFINPMVIFPKVIEKTAKI